MLESLEARLMLAADYRNPANPWDVNQDLNITALDALQVINEAGRRESPVLDARPDESTEGFWDVTGDDMITALDALRVINFLGRNEGEPVPKIQEGRFDREFSFPITVGEETGTRNYRFEIHADFDTTDDVAALNDVFNVYIVSPEDKSQTLVDAGTNGEPVFSLVGGSPRIKPGISRFDGSGVEIDLTGIVGTDTAEILFQYLNTDSDDGGSVTVRPISNSIVDDSLSTESTKLPEPTVVAPGVPNDPSSFEPFADVQLTFSDVRYNSISGLFEAELELQAGETSTGRNVAIVIPNLPAGVELLNRSGVNSAGDPYVNVRPAIQSGGLARGLRSQRIHLQFSNPQSLPIDLQADVYTAGENTAPDLPTIGPLSVMPGERLDVVLPQTDQDGDNVEYSIRSDAPLPNGVIGANKVLTFSPRPGQEGIYEFSVVASDGTDSSSQTVSLEVVSDPLSTTRYAGTVRNTNDVPLAGLRLTIGDLEVFSDVDGKFLFETAGDFPSGSIEIHGDAFNSDDPYPYMKKKLSFFLDENPISGALNSVHRVIYLPILDTSTTVPVEANAETVVTNSELPDAELVIAQGAAVDVNGTPLTGRIGFMEVPANRTPRDLPPELLPNPIYAIYTTEMNGAEFEVPAQLTVPNKSGYAPGTELDLWEVDAVSQRFEVFGTGRVSDDGSVIEPVSGGTLSAIGGNNGANWRVYVLRPGPFRFEADDLTCGCGKPTQSFSSEVELNSGALLESHDLVTYQSAGETRGLTLRYDSLRASPSKIVRFSYPVVNQLIDLSQGGSAPPPISFISASVSVDANGIDTAIGVRNESIGRGSTNEWHLPEIENGQHVSASVNIPLGNHETGLYDYGVDVGLYQGSDIDVVSGVSQGTRNTLATVNQVDSPFGAGWSLSGLQRVVEKPINERTRFSGAALLVDGDGSDIVFRKSELSSDYQSPIGDFSVLEKLADGTFRRTMKDQTVYQFDERGNISSVTDRNGNATEYMYSAEGRLDGIRDPAGLVTSFVYNGHHVSQIIDPAGRVTKLEHDENGDLKRITDPDDTSRYWDYDARHRMIGETIKRGFTETTIYDQYSGRVIAGTRADGSEVHLSSEEFTNLDGVTVSNDLPESDTTQYIDSNGNLQNFRLSETGLVTTVADEMGIHEILERNDDGLVSSRTDARAFTTSFVYDTRGNVLEIADEISGGISVGTVEWIGASGDWHDADNWSTGAVPGPSDTVIIDVDDANTTVTIQAEPVVIYRVVSDANFTIDGASLTTSGPTRFDGLLDIRNDATLSTLGTAITANSEVKIDASNLDASRGGLFNFPTLTAFENNRLSLAGTSRFSAGLLESIDDSQFHLSAGATFAIPPRITEYSADPNLHAGLGAFIPFQAEGEGTRLDLSSIASFEGGHYLDDMLISATNGGEIDLSGLKTVSTNAAGFFTGNLVFKTENGGSIDLSSVESLNGDFNGLGIQLDFDGTQYVLPELQTASKLRLNLPPGFNLDLPKLTRLNVSSEIPVIANQSVNAPLLTELLDTKVTLDGTGTLTTGILDSIDDSQFHLSGGATFAIPAGITSYSADPDLHSGLAYVPFQVEGEGTRLDLSPLTVFEGGHYLDDILISAADGGEIELSGLTTVTTNGAGFSTDNVIFRSENGGSIDISSVESLNGNFNGLGILLDFAGAQHTLPELQTASKLRLSLPPNFNLDLPKLTSLSGGSELPGTERRSINAPLLTELLDTRVTLDGTGDLTTGVLTAIDDSQFILSDGATYTLPSTITSYSTDPALHKSFSPLPVFTVNGEGTRLDLSSLQSIDAAHSFSDVVVSATNGGEIDLSGLTTVTTDAAGDDDADLVFRTASGGAIDLTSVESFDTHKDGLGVRLDFDTDQYILPELQRATKLRLPNLESYQVSLPKLTFLDGASLPVTGNRVFSAPRLTELLDTDVTLDGTGDLTTGILTAIDDSQFALSGGAIYTLPSTITSYSTDPALHRSFSAIPIFTVDGEGTRLDLSSLHSIEATHSFSDVVVSATNGGEINLSGLTTVTTGAAGDDDASLVFRSESGGSIDLSSVESLSPNRNGLGISIESFGSTTLGNPSLDRTTIRVDDSGALTGNTITIAGGNEATASGTVVADFIVAGTLSVPADTTLNVAESLTQQSSSTLAVQLGAMVPPQGIVAVDGEANLAGTLSVVIDASFKPSVGDRHVLLSYDSRLGDFDSVVGLDSVDGLEFTLHTLGNRIEVEVTSVPSGVLGELVEVPGFAADASANAGSEDNIGAMTESTDGESADTPSPRPKRFTYEPLFNQMTSETDELGRLTFYETDPNNGNVTMVSRVIGKLDDTENGENNDLVTTMTYGDFGLLDLHTDELGRVTDYDYDPLGRLVKITYAVGTNDEAFEEFEYDGAGNQTAVIDENGNRTEFAFDDLNRLTRIVEPDPDGDGPLTSPVTIFTYDAAGNLETTTDAEQSTIANTYDPLDRLETTTDEQSNVTRYGYDHVGNLTSVTDPLQHETTYEYDARNRLRSTTDPDGGITTYEYDPDDNLVALIDPVGNRTQFRYDARDRLITEVDPLGKGTLGAVRLMRGEHSDFSGLRGASGQRQSVLTEAISHTLCSKSCSTEYNEVS